MVKTMNQSISRFLGRLAKSFGGEEDQEVSLRKSELKEIEQESIPNLENKEKISPLLKIVPKEIATKLVLKKTFEGYCHDVSQDFKIWENKIYIDPPILAKGDGPVAQYRMWAQQFYYDDSKQPNYATNTID